MLLTHADLIPNLWINLGEIAGNGIDDDDNGYIDDIHGWNAYSSNGSIPSDGHGTHVAGIVGAKGNNGTNVSIPKIRNNINKGISLPAIIAVINFDFLRKTMF